MLSTAREPSPPSPDDETRAVRVPRRAAAASNEKLTREEPLPQRREADPADAKLLRHPTLTTQLPVSDLHLTAPVVSLRQAATRQRPVTALVEQVEDTRWQGRRSRRRKTRREPSPSARPAHGTSVAVVGTIAAVRPPLRTPLEVLISHCCSVETGADVVVAVGPPSRWQEPAELKADAEQLVWFERMQEPAVYEVARTKLPAASFLHGEAGLVALEERLQSIGALPRGLRKDSSAADALHRLRSRWLRTINQDLERFLGDLPREPSARRDAWQRQLRQLIGGAGSYGMREVAATAQYALLSLGQPGPSLAWEGQTIVALHESVARETSNQQEPQQAARSALELSTRNRVLVLADDPQLARQLDFALTARRLEVVVETDVPRLLRRVEQVQPDAVVVQAGLKAFDGLDVASQLRSQRACEAIPIIAVVDRVDAETCQRAARCRVDTWIVRPFSAETAVLTVLAALRRNETIRDLGGRDPVTGLYSHRTTLERLESELRRARRLGQYVGVLLAHLPDTDGEFQRDAFTRLAHAAHRTLRSTDVLGRFNERTLFVVLPGVDVRVLQVLAERIRREVRGAVSFEVAATVCDGSAEPAALFADVQARMLRAIAGDTQSAIGRFEAGQATRTTGDAPRVLVVDTDAAIVELLRFFCAREGMEVTTAADGQRALEALERAETMGQLPDLVMLDTFIPGVDATTVIDRIHRRYGARVPVMAMSVSDVPERVVAAFDAGALDVISKPFSVTELMARLRRVLSRAGAL